MVLGFTIDLAIYFLFRIDFLAVWAGKKSSLRGTRKMCCVVRAHNPEVAGSNPAPATRVFAGQS
jgi:hypothetical protein